MKVIRAASRPTKQQPATYFTGTVFADEVVVGTKPSRMRATVVSFTPGARTAWHTHPVGQVQRQGEAVQELHPGDTVVIPPDVRHWHGAAPDRLFAHLAMSEVTDSGAGTEWLEQVSDADYLKAPAPIG